MAKRFIKSPKLYLTDSGLYCHLLDIRDTHTLKTSAHKGGGVVETFVFGELIKHIAYSQTRPRLYHYRTSDKKEIDFILEKNSTLFAIEVEASQNIKPDTFKPIIDLQNKTHKQVIGIVLYTGENLLSFGEEGHGRYAVPLGVFF